MKTLTLVAALALTVFSSGCTLKEVIGPDGTIKVIGSGSGANSGTNTGSGATGTDIQPLKTGTTWTYQMVRQPSGTPIVTLTMTGNTEQIDGKPFQEYEVVSSDNSPGVTQSGYFYHADNIYYNRDESIGTSAYQNVPYMKDNAVVNDTWTTNTTALLPNYTGTLVGTLKEAGINRVVNGAVFNNVYHTVVEEHDDNGTDQQIPIVYDYYIAKGIGIIEMQEVVSGHILFTETILRYKIK